MVRFKNTNNKSILIFISDLIRKIFGGDRLKRISIQISKLLNQIHKEKKKKINCLRFWMWVHGTFKTNTKKNIH